VTRDEFEALIQRLADAWAALEAESAVACFTDDAVYMQPPDEQLFLGRDELLAYFAPLEPGTYLRLDNLWFDEGRQRGTVEFTFGVGDQDPVDHGMSVVDVADGRIRAWREYLVKGPADQERFLATDGKDWRWHIGNLADES
jgi:ketosteroid isomerase-like protein